MRLKPLFPSLPAPLLPLAQLLFNLGYTQSNSLIFESSLQITSQLPSDSPFKIKDVERLQSEVAKLTSPVFSKGDVLLEAERVGAEKRKGKWAGVGEKGIDGLVEGLGEGGGGGVVEIAGEEGAIRTLVALHAVMNHLVQNEKSTVLWIDTQGEFQVDQAVGVLETKNAALTSASVLDRLEVVPVFDLATFSKIVSDLHLDLPEPPDDGAEEQVGRRSKGITMLVVDTISALYGDFIASTKQGGSMEGQASLVAHLHHLSTLSRSHPLLTILTNGTSPSNKSPYPFPSRLQRTNAKPALDNLFSHLTDLTLWLERPVDHNPGKGGAVVVAQVLRNRIGRAGTFSAFWTNGTTLETYTAYV